jgi:hypothetical protein
MYLRGDCLLLWEEMKIRLCGDHLVALPRVRHFDVCVRMAKEKKNRSRGLSLRSKYKPCSGGYPLYERG